jgi:hypothetical protein
LDKKRGQGQRKEGTPGEFVQMLATERLAKLIDNVKELIKVE